MKQILISFIVFAGIVLICRHIVSDIKQEQRIEVLENLVSDLYHQRDTVIIEHNDTLNISKTTPITKSRQQLHNPSYPPLKGTTRDHKDTTKFSTPILLDLNIIDSLTLIKIPGIGSKTASNIIRYRNQLGGFYSPRQLSEKLTWDGAQERMDEWCTKWFYADTVHIKRLNVNEADFKSLLRHPYLNYEQTKALVNYRDKHNGVSGINVLSMLECFTEEDIERLKHYLDFKKKSWLRP